MDINALVSCVAMPSAVTVLAKNNKQTMHYSDVIMSTMASQVTSLTIVCSTVYSDANRKHQCSASLAFVWGIHRWLVNSRHKGLVMSSWTLSFLSIKKYSKCIRLFSIKVTIEYVHFDGLVQDCSNSIAFAMELLQSSTKPSIYCRNSSQRKVLNTKVRWQNL